jgi:hypothetical protein
VSEALATRERHAPPEARDSGRLFEAGGSSLEDLVLAAWEDLALHGRADCPVCRAELLGHQGCASCGSELS